MECPVHPGVKWFRTTAMSTAGYEEPPCFVCDPAWWGEHVALNPDMSPYQTDGRQPGGVVEAVQEMVDSGHWPPRPPRPPGIHGSPVDWDAPLP